MRSGSFDRNPRPERITGPGPSLGQREADIANPSVCYSLAHALCAEPFPVPGRLPRRLSRVLHTERDRFGHPAAHTRSEPARFTLIRSRTFIPIFHFTLSPIWPAAENARCTGAPGAPSPASRSLRYARNRFSTQFRAFELHTFHAHEQILARTGLSKMYFASPFCTSGVDCEP